MKARELSGKLTVVRNMNDYKDERPDLTEEGRQRIAEAAKQCHTGRKRSAEVRLRMSLAMRGKKHVFSEEGRRNLAAAASRTHTGRKRSEETCRAISLGNAGKPKTEACKEKIRATLSGRTLTIEAREKISAGVAERFLGLGIPGRPGLRGVHTSLKCKKEVQYKSPLERRFMEFFDHDGFVLEYSYEPFSIAFQYTDYIRHYIPDFLVIRESASPQLVEVRPKNFRKGDLDQAKWRAARAFCAERNWEFVLVSKEDLPHMPTRNQAGRMGIDSRPEGSETRKCGNPTNTLPTSAGQLPCGVEEIVRHSDESRRAEGKEPHA